MKIKAYHRSQTTRRRGFTLVELMVAIAVSSIAIASLLSTFVFFTKTSLSMSNYYDMSQQNRNFLQHLSQDIREAEDIEWTSASRFILTSKGLNITYNYDSQLETVSRQLTGEASHVLANDLGSLEFKAFSILGNELAINNDLINTSQLTKMVQVVGVINKKTTTIPNASTPIVSAHYMLRNKQVVAP